MIKFALRCSNGDAFESWFKSGSAYDEQVSAGQVVCPICQCSSVTKAIMAPFLSSRREDAGKDEEAAAPAPVVPAAMIFSERDAHLREILAQLREHILATSDDLGSNFADEALRNHRGAAPERAIRGQASFDDIQLLADEGVRVLPVPRTPGDFN